jgi:hypothetical protein
MSFTRAQRDYMILADKRATSDVANALFRECLCELLEITEQMRVYVAFGTAYGGDNPRLSNALFQSIPATVSNSELPVTVLLIDGGFEQTPFDKFGLNIVHNEEIIPGVIKYVCDLADTPHITVFVIQASPFYVDNEGFDTLLSILCQFIDRVEEQGGCVLIADFAVQIRFNGEDTVAYFELTRDRKLDCNIVYGMHCILKLMYAVQQHINDKHMRSKVCILYVRSVKVAEQIRDRLCMPDEYDEHGETKPRRPVQYPVLIFLKDCSKQMLSLFGHFTPQCEKVYYVYFGLPDKINQETGRQEPAGADILGDVRDMRFDIVDGYVVIETHSI